ncbi:MAG: hypothetical protein JWM55_1031 [Acidimicrobiaceae bacterium]|nr:hypothetical protein [Acidimicrobiaceae bacterium]
MSGPSATSQRLGGRVFRLGPTRAIVVALCALALAGCGTSGAVYPSFLPKKTLHPTVDAALTGTMAKPALQIEGLPVIVDTPSYHVRVTVSGPVVPGEGLPDQPTATTCTWTVTMKDASARVPVSVADFHSVDHLDSVLLMGLVPGEKAPPRFIHPGEMITFKLRAYELVGEGMMQWAPDHRHVVANWDYAVEND